ncbi:hypothetical protein H0R92_01245 [Treponema sp. OMZ 840]|uniref:hypothetical protein n=1 Tax=Treponema sp. OMZ 840 TaxID=244313 RepID=UPI003D94C60F
MEQSITFKIRKRQLVATLSAFFFTPKILSVLFGLSMLTVFPHTLKPFSATRLIASVLTAAVFTLPLVIILLLMILIRAAFIFKQEKQYASDIAVRFYDTFLEEITVNNTLTVQYADIYKLKLRKTVLLIYLSSLRAIVIPASTEYDIKKLYAELHIKTRQG